MTLLDDRPLGPEAVPGGTDGTGGDGEGGAAAPDVPVVRSADDAEQPASVPLTGLATFCAVAAAGWMAAGVFRGAMPRVIALVAAAVGVGLVVLSYRSKRPSTVQYLALPTAVVLGALFVLPFAKGGSANLPNLVLEAFRSGGIAQPPVPFDPGWRFVLVVLVTMLGAASAALATGLNRPKVGIALPAPLLFAAALVQPQGATFTSSVVALVLFVGAFGVSYGVDLAREGATSGEFEVRRFGRAAGMLALLVAALVVLSQAGFLFPDPTDEQVIPPRRPPTPPPQADRVLFTVDSPRMVPLHLGVLDVYQDDAWMTPPFDPKRFTKVPDDGRLAMGEGPGEVHSLAPIPDEKKLAATFRINDVEGHSLPSIANPQRVAKRGFAVEYDPRTQDLRLPERRAEQGMTYTVEARTPPTAAEMNEAPAPPEWLAEYLDVPQPPQEILDLLAQAPKEPAFDRLQFVRNRYYQSVVAAGAGNPVDVAPFRVVQMLQGQEASPYEITAGEVLLARWAGVPARIGYGYYGGERSGETTWSVRPKHGATWLETYWEGYGWVPILGTPPKAKASLSSQPKNQDPTIRPTDEAALLVYVPVRLRSIQMLYEIVRYWVVRVLPWVAAGGLVVAFYPGVLKLGRRYRRRRWALRLGPAERIAVAYAEFRDAANDMNIGDPMLTPLRFLDRVAPDAEHTELAWLVTRGLWGDLTRDLRREDAEAAEDMARSVTRRLRRANTVLNRLVAFGSRVSLRTPYSGEVPNLWPRWSLRRSLRRALRHALHRLPLVGRRLAARRPVPGAAVIVLLALFFGACGSGAAPAREPGSSLPPSIVPEQMGDIDFVREHKAEEAYVRAGDDALVSTGRVYSLHRGETIEGSFQVGEFKPGLDAQNDELRAGVLNGLGTGSFELTRLGTERVFELRLPEHRMFVWFPPNGRYYQLMVARQGFDQAEELFVSILAHQRGSAAPTGPVNRAEPLDPRRTVMR